MNWTIASPGPSHVHVSGPGRNSFVFTSVPSGPYHIPHVCIERKEERVLERLHRYADNFSHFLFHIGFAPALFSGTTWTMSTTTVESSACAVPMSESGVLPVGTSGPDSARHGQNPPSTGQPPTTAQPATASLYVSTSLACWETAKTEMFHRDVQLNDVAYRRLDPEYYAWLRSRMNLARLAVLAGQLDQDEFDALRDRFNRIHEWATSHFTLDGSGGLAAAVRVLDARGYAAPVAEPWDRHKAQPGPSGASPEALAMVNAIRVQALGLGWKEERLYTAGKPLSPLCGLAAYLNPGDRIGEVTREAIEVIVPSGVHQRFFNPDVAQPWIRRSESGKS